MSSPLYLSQNFSTTLNVGGGIDASQTTGIVLTSVSGLNTSGGYLCLDWAAALDTSVAEYISYTGIAGNTLTGVTRGSEGSSGKAHSNGATIVAVVSKNHVNILADKLRGVDVVAIEDTSANELLKTSTTASAVNELTIANAATANAPSLAATGGDTNIDLNLISKGTGVIKFNGVAAPTGGTDGWTSDTHTWVYASASTFTIAGVDLTTTFTKGTRLKFTNSTVKYATVVSSAFSTNTTVTIAVNTDYVIANAAISSPFYSYQANPQGYPTWFNWTPTYTSSGGAFTNAPATTTAIISFLGNQATIQTDFVYNATSGGSGNTQVRSLPVTPATNQAGAGLGASTGKALFVQADTTPQLSIANYDATTCIANSQRIQAGITYKY